jgi:hypothetical protein
VTLTASGGSGLDAQRMSVDSLDLSLGKTSLSLKGAIKPLDLSLELREAPFTLAREFGGPELPEGSLSELNARLGPGGSGSFDLKASALMSAQTGPPLKFAADAKGVLEDGRTLSGEINLVLPSRPGGRNRRAAPAQRTPSLRAFLSSVAKGPSFRRASGKKPETPATPASSTSPASPDASAPGNSQASGTGGDAAPATASPASGTASGASSGAVPDITQDPGRNAPDLSPVNVKYRLPFKRGGALPLPDMTAPLQAEVKWTGRVESVWRFLSVDDRFLSGGIDIDARL